MPAKTQPPPPLTGLSNPDCYAAPLADCSPGRSKEHYVSDAILERIVGADKVIILGGASFSPHSPIRASAKSLASHILCPRHNSALSALDSEASRLFADLLSITQKNQVVTASYCGEDIERWVLKLVIGLFHSGVPSTREGGKVESSPAQWMLDILFGLRKFNVGAGLGVYSGPTKAEHALAVSYNANEDGLVWGLGLCIFGVRFHLMLAMRLTDLRETYTHHPLSIEFSNGSKLMFDWQPSDQAR